MLPSLPRQSLAAFRYYQELIIESDQEIQRQLGDLDTAATAERTIPKTNQGIGTSATPL